jgi:regulator of replication initiation timing
MSNDDSVYRSDAEAMRSKISSLMEENDELRSEIERLQSLVDADNKAIVFCPIEEDEEYETDSDKSKWYISLLQFTQFVFLIFAYFTFDKFYLFAISILVLFISFLLVLTFIYKEKL